MNSMFKVLFFLGLILTLLSGCKHTEKVVIEKKIKPISVRRVVRMMNDNELKYNTLSVKRVNLTINNNGNTKSVKGWYKIRRDSIIQASAQKLTFPVGKLELDTASFTAVYHMEKLVITGLIQKFGDLIGYDLDYQFFQSILSNHLQSMNQVVKENKFKDYVLTIDENMYKISSIKERRFRKFSNNEEKLERFKNRKEEQHLVKQDIYIDPDIFVVRKLIFNDIESGRIVTIEFSEFTPLAGKWFPGKIHVSSSGKESLELLVELSKVSLDDEKDFSFSVPEKYKKEGLERIKF